MYEGLSGRSAFARTPEKYIRQIERTISQAGAFSRTQFQKFFTGRIYDDTTVIDKPLFKLQNVQFKTKEGSASVFQNMFDNVNAEFAKYNNLNIEELYASALIGYVGDIYGGEESAAIECAGGNMALLVRCSDGKVLLQNNPHLYRLNEDETERTKNVEEIVRTVFFPTRVHLVCIALSFLTELANI